MSFSRTIVFVVKESLRVFDDLGLYIFHSFEYFVYFILAPHSSLELFYNHA